MSLVCKRCKSSEVIRWGGKNNTQGWKCKKCGHYFNYGLKLMKTNIEPIHNFSLGYIIGVLKGDGCLTITQDYHYFDDNYKQVPKAQATKIIPRQRHTIALQCKDKDFATEFQKRLLEITLKKATLYPVTTKTTMPIEDERVPHIFHGFNVRLTSIEWFNKFLLLTKSMSWIETENIEVQKGFLKGFFDSEGSAQPRPQITLYNKNVELLNLSKKLLVGFGIESRIYPASSKYTVPFLSIYRINSVKNYMDKIGFSIERKRKKIKRKENGNIQWQSKNHER